MAGSGDIDSVEIFEEAKHRARSDDGCLEEAEQMYELYTLRHRRATYPGGFEAVSSANVSRDRIVLATNINVEMNRRRS